MEPARHQQREGLRLHQSIAYELGTAILSGQLKPGDNIGNEIESSEARGVSRTAYREALRMLVAKGLVTSRPKTGTHVTSREHWNLLDPEVLAWAFASEPDPRLVENLFELRGIIEPAAAELAAQRRDERELRAMSDAIAVMRSCGLATETGRQADQDFHRLILAAADNEALYSLASSVAAAVSWTTRFKQRRRRRPRDPLPEHEAVFEGIRRGDGPEARAAMKELLDLALADMGLPKATRTKSSTSKS